MNVHAELMSVVSVRWFSHYVWRALCVSANSEEDWSWTQNCCRAIILLL